MNKKSVSQIATDQIFNRNSVKIRYKCILLQLDYNQIQEHIVCGVKDLWKRIVVENMCLAVMKNTFPPDLWPSDSMLSIKNTAALRLSMHHFQTGSSYLPGAIQVLNPPAFHFKCLLMPDSNQYLKAEFRSDK